MDKIPEFVMNHPELFLALAGLLAVIAAGPVISRLQGLSPLGPADALSLMNHQDALLLDIREDKEYQDGHVLGSMHIPLSRLTNEIGKIKHDKGKPVIALCNSGARSRSACSTLKKHGFESVHNLTGGISAWKSANLPLTRK